MRRRVIVLCLPGGLVFGPPWASPPPARTAAWPRRALVAWRLHGQPLLRWIALTSVVFYAFAGHWWFIVPMLVTTAVDYWVAIAIEHEARPRARGWLLALSLAGNLGMLADFKYSGLVVRTVEQGLVAAGSRWCSRRASASTRSRCSPTSSMCGGARRPPSATSSASRAS